MNLQEMIMGQAVDCCRRGDEQSSCLHRASMTIKHFIIQLMHNIQFVDTIKIIKYLKVLRHVSDHRASIIGEPCTVLG